MKDIVEIRTLIERFFEGDTTLEEEQWLYDFFKQPQSLPEDLEVYRETFLDFDAIALDNLDNSPIDREEHENQLTTTNISINSKPPKYKVLWKQVAGIAAMLTLIVGSIWVYWAYEDMKLQDMYGGSYMIVDGERIDNLREILPQIKQTLSLADAIETTSPTLFIDQAEKDLLDNIQDAQERERIRELLNQ